MRLAELTPREHEVMAMVTDGRSNKEIASALGVSAKTVEAHRARVMEKMRADSLAELVRMALIATGRGRRVTPPPAVTNPVSRVGATSG